MNRKLWSNEEKVAIVLEILRSDEPVAVICSRHGVSETQAYGWFERFPEGGRYARPNQGIYGPKEVCYSWGH